jgi:hypothetical protein
MYFFILPILLTLLNLYWQLLFEIFNAEAQRRKDLEFNSLK